MTYADHIDYFRQLGAAHRQIKSVIVGDYQDIIQKERADIQYPALWIESPDSQFVGDNDHFEEMKSGSFVILQNGDPKDEEKRLYNLEQTYRIAREVALRMLKDFEYMRFEIKNRRLTMIASIYNDHDQGWRFSFDQYCPLDDDDNCYNLAPWNTDIRHTDRLIFSLILTGTSISATVQEFPEGYTLTWALYINNASVSAGSYASSKTWGKSAGDQVYVILTATKDGHTRQASCFASETDTYTSVPFLYNKYR